MMTRIKAIAGVGVFGRFPLAAVLVCVILALAGSASSQVPPAGTPAMRVDINTDFPGGNAIEKRAGDTVYVAPDLGGGKSWFYWYFEASVNRPGRVNFVFRGLETVYVGHQGPAVSNDLGKSWRWMGSAGITENSFSYEFTKAGEKVRFAVTIPYLQSDLDAFLKDNAANPNLSSGVLTKSLKGRSVELLQAGKPGPGVKAVLLTARHHACETMASFVVEGFVKAAISDTPAGAEFRKNHVLYVVPFVDKDGVEDGDQGKVENNDRRKGRKAHDHNRDYGQGSLYPEVQAIQELGDSMRVQFAVDFHCPRLRNRETYFAGTRQHPPMNHENISEFARLIKEELPPGHPRAPVVRTSEGGRAPFSGGTCSGYFAFRKDMIMATTLEVPYALPDAPMDGDAARKYGETMFNAWVKTKFIAGDAEQ